ncbi:DUF2142 domain-containing protein [Streptomyces sp. BR123]|uniref:DUF2142 domain-containing protein n=1 Tax=Streptomyces sp. BR123 TaxID=2749828 RepID=UPI0015C432FD|nr:DUF2142 domain-containing protein [Streptomyces sp. BR123]NXY92841.1 DUF2142 domain-containing protein [Streptomyces sp. BR123]
MSSYSTSVTSLPAPSTSEIGRRGAYRPSRLLFQRTWWTAFIGFFLLCAGWALAAPYDASPDEAQHIIRAAGVARGEFAPRPEAAGGGTGAFQHVPVSLVRENCWAFDAGKSAACAKPIGGDERVEKVATRAGRYNPIFYAVVGWPLALWPNWSGVTLARLISAGLVSALLASAAHSMVAWTRHRVAAAGVLAAVTPITAHLAGSVNPNGVEIAAGLALIAALVPTVLEPDQPLRQAAMVQIGIAGGVLMTLRALGPVWCTAVIGIMLIPAKRERLRALLRFRPVWWMAGALLVTGAAGALWTVVMKASEMAPVNVQPQVTLAQGLRHEVIVRWPNYFTEMIGVPSWLDTHLPGTAYDLWYLVLGALILPAVAFGRWSDRGRLFALFIVPFGVITLSDAVGAHKYGFGGQGRYLLPVTVGVPLLAAYLIGRRGVLDEERSAKLVRTVALVVLPLQLAFLAYTMIRWQTGVGSSLQHTPLNPLAGNWHPPAGSATALLVGTAGCALLGWWAWTSTCPTVAEAAPEPRPVALSVS